MIDAELVRCMIKMSSPIELYIDETCRDQFAYKLDEEFGKDKWRLFSTRYNYYDLTQIPQVLYIPITDNENKPIGLAIIINTFDVEMDEFGNRFITTEPYKIEIQKVKETDKICLQCSPTPHSETLHSPKGCVVEGCGCRLVNSEFIKRKSH